MFKWDNQRQMMVKESANTKCDEEQTTKNADGIHKNTNNKDDSKYKQKLQNKHNERDGEEGIQEEPPENPQKLLTRMILLTSSIA